MYLDSRILEMTLPEGRFILSRMYFIFLSTSTLNSLFKRIDELCICVLLGGNCPGRSATVSRTYIVHIYFNNMSIIIGEFHVKSTSHFTTINLFV